MNPVRFISVALLLVLAACAVAPPGDASPMPSGTDPGPSRPVVDASRIPIPSRGGDNVTGEVPQDLLDAILADAAQRSGTPAESLEVVTAAAVTWNDGSLGCPEPGMFYTQALVDGYQVVIDTGDEQLDYRVGSGGSFRLCENPTPPGGTNPSE
jgi:hypothetical protein